MDWKGEKRACNDNSSRRVLSLYVAAKSMYKNLCVDLSVTGKCFRQWVAQTVDVLKQINLEPCRHYHSMSYEKKVVGCWHLFTCTLGCLALLLDEFDWAKSKVDKSEGCFFQLWHLKLCCTSKAVALRQFHKLELKVMSYLTLDMRLAHKQQRPPEEYTELHTEAWWFAKLLIPGKFALNILISTFGISLDPRSNMISAFCMLPSSPCAAERDYQFKQICLLNSS